MKEFLSRPNVLFVLKIAVSIGLVAGLIWYIDFKELIESLSHANYLLLALGFSLVVVNIGLHFYRWRYVLRLVSPAVSDEEVFTSLMVGLTAGFFTPGQIGEFAGRIASHPELRKSHVVGVSIIDKLYLLALTFIFGIISIPIFIFLYYQTLWTGLYGIAAVTASLSAVFLCLKPTFAKKIFKIIPERFKKHSLYNVVDIIDTRFHEKEGRVLFILTGLLYILIFTQFFIFASAFEPISFSHSFMCASSIYFVKAIVLPLSIGDLGIRESASVFFFSKVGFSAASAFNASMCMFFANLAIPSLIGSFLILKLKIK